MGSAPIRISQQGAFLMVVYPHRKTPDLYIAIKGHNTACMQCEEGSQEIPKTKRRSVQSTERLIAHIRTHDRRRKRRG